MAGITLRTSLSHRRIVATCLATASASAAAAILIAAPARADAVAYLVNVTVRAGYNFASPDAALDYGRRICGRVASGARYAEQLGDVMADFRTNDEYQASYLINQAVNELCPDQIWQLRNSAARYQPPTS